MNINTTLNITINNTSFDNPTYGQLKKMLPGTGKGRVPGVTALRKEKQPVVIEAQTTGAVITVYANGFFTYVTEKQSTVQGVDRCEEDMKSFLNPEVAGAADADIEQFVWIFPLEIAGSNRVEHNADSQDEDYRLFSIDEDLDARNEQLSHRPEHEEIEERLAQEEEIALLHKGIAGLTERQRSIVYLRYVKEKTHDQIASELKISRRTVREHLEKAEKNLRKFME